MEEGKTFGDYFAVLKRRWITILLVFVGVFLPGVFVSYSIPPTYRSTATILIEQQSISSEFVQTTVTGYTDEQIQEVRQRVMSTNHLREIGERYGLYADDGLGPGALVERVRDNTFFEPQTAEVINERTGRTMLATISFDISFEYSNAVTTQQVAADLADLYLRENVGNRSDQVKATIDFLESDIQSIKQEVDRANEALLAFRDEHGGDLPTQSNFNLQAINRTEQQIYQIDADLRSARDRKLTLEGQLATLNPVASVFDENGNPIVGTAQQLANLQSERLRLLSIYSAEHPDVVRIEKEIEVLGGNGQASRLSDIQAQVAAARNALADARLRYSDDHPDVRQQVRSLAALEQQLSNALSQQRAYSAPVALSPEARQLQLQIDAANSDIAQFSRRRAELSARLDELQNAVARLPEASREYTALNQDYELASERYNEALKNLDEARMAERLETGGAAERFTLIGNAQVPANPFKPNRTAILLLVIVLGLGGGMILATFLDTLDDTVKDAKEVYQLGGVPALAVVPYLETPQERRSRVMLNSGMIGLLVTSMIIAVIISQTVGQ
ncbi:MAG: Wzz/FepE/Etk N-terminal domain-containing protein [Pseudomonadota bacterium]